MPGYVPQALICFQHPPSVKIQDKPYPHAKSSYGAKMHHATPEDTSPPLDKVGKKLSKKCAESSFSLHAELTAAYFPHSAP
jgi:hypothetical protein